MTIASRVLACGAVLLGLGVAPVAPAGAQGYHVARTVVLGGDGGWDYVALDTVGRRLFIARQDRVMVVDPASGKVLAEIPGLNRAHGIAFPYQAGRGFATSGADSAVTIFDLASLRVVGHTTVAPDDDAILYDPVTKRIVTFNGDAHSASMLNPASGKHIGTIELGGGPEFGVSAGDGKLYVNLEDKAAVVVIDATAMKVTRQWSLAPCEAPTGLAIDRAHHRPFRGCRHQLMAISYAAKGRVLMTVQTRQRRDVRLYDADTVLSIASRGFG